MITSPRFGSQRCYLSHSANAQVRQPAERLGLNPSVCGFKSRLGHQDCSHERKDLGSAHTGDKTTRYANRKSGEAQTFVCVGSTPTRVIRSKSAVRPQADSFDDQFDDQVVQLVDTRCSERRAPRGLGVQISPWSFSFFAGGAGARPAFIRPAIPDRYRGLQWT